MLNLKKITYKNFMGVGNWPLTIDLQKTKTTLITGLNGAGKSSLLEAIVFALYGRSYRGVNKDELINKTNAKQCSVILEFTANGKEYVITRTMKPNNFEIQEDGKLLDKEAAVKDMQSFLEENIIKKSYKTFCQVDILGSANYVPFMQLKAADRREVVENLLDIGIFSDMNDNLKTKISQFDINIKENEKEIAVLEATIESHRRMIEKVEGVNDKNVNLIKAEIHNIKTEIIALTDEVKSYEDGVLEYETVNSELQTAKEHINTLNHKLTTHTTKLEALQKPIRDTCNECGRLHDDATIAKATEIRNEEIDWHEGFINHIKNQISTIQTNSEIKADKLKSLLPIIKAHTDAKARLNFLGNMGVTKTTELKALKLDASKDINEEKRVLSEHSKTLFDLNTTRNKLLKQKDVFTLASRMLKDSGVKSVVIKKYIPLFNMHVNKFLNLMNFNIKFSLNENFEECIKVAGGQEYTYKLFSMGQRMRIDLAVLFAWRELTRARNSMPCNFLALDEIFDSSLDSDGAEDLMSILTSMGKDVKVIVISHRADNLVDLLDRHLVFKMESGFTAVEEQ